MVQKSSTAVYSSLDKAEEGATRDGEAGDSEACVA